MGPLSNSMNGLLGGLGGSLMDANTYQRMIDDQIRHAHYASLAQCAGGQLGREPDNPVLLLLDT